MRLSRILLLIGAFALPAVPAAAQGKAIGKPAGVGKPTTIVKGASGTVVKGKSADAKAGTLVKGRSADRAKGPKATPTDVAATNVSGEENGGGQLPFHERIAQNKQLNDRLTAMLEGTGLTLTDAASGFKNQGQFIAALETSKNNNISFVDLKAKMIGENAVSLGQALQALKPDTSEPDTTTTTTP